jgi:hypothetical protein
VSAAARKGSCWYRPDNPGRWPVRIAAERFAADLLAEGRIIRQEKDLLDEIARWIDRKATAQLSIAFLAARRRMSERTIQLHLRRLAPSKQKDPDGWAKRVLTRRFMHLAPEPGKKADNAPSWFTIEIPARYFERPKPRPAPAPPPPAPPPPAPAPRPDESPSQEPRPFPWPVPGVVGGKHPPKMVSPGGVEKITQAVILGSDREEISETIHPCTNLGAPLPPAAEPPERAELAPPVRGGASDKPDAGTSPPAAGAKQQPPPDTPAPGKQRPPPELVKLAAQLFPSHVGRAAWAVEKLQGLGLTDKQIKRTLKSAARDRSIERADHPLLTVVWRVEKTWRICGPPRGANALPAGVGPPRTAVRTVSHAELAERKHDAERAAQIARLRFDGATQRPRLGEGSARGAPANDDDAAQRSTGGPEDDDDGH